MKKNNERVLAYSMSKIMNLNELSAISGSGSDSTHRSTWKITGPNGGDVAFDISPDCLT